jgi:hypothetical protein
MILHTVDGCSPKIRQTCDCNLTPLRNVNKISNRAGVTPNGSSVFRAKFTVRKNPRFNEKNVECIPPTTAHPMPALTTARRRAHARNPWQANDSGAGPIATRG